MPIRPPATPPPDIQDILSGGTTYFGTRGTCPACLTPVARDNGTAYCEQSHVRGIFEKLNGPNYLDDTRFGTGHNPHLHITCQTCGFEWLELPAWQTPRT